MARLGIWDLGLGIGSRFDASRGFVVRRAFRTSGVDHAADAVFPKDGVGKHELRRLYMARLIAYAPPGTAFVNLGPDIPADYAKLPFFALRKLAKLISGQPVADKPAALDIVHAELLRRA